MAAKRKPEEAPKEEPKVEAKKAEEPAKEPAPPAPAASFSMDGASVSELHADGSLVYRPATFEEQVAFAAGDVLRLAIGAVRPATSGTVTADGNVITLTLIA